MSSRNYSEKDIKRLYALSGNRCSNPDCNNHLVNIDLTNLSDIAHIKGFEKGSARYDKNITDKVKNSFENLLLLCKNCHKIVDDDKNGYKYSVELLQKWKEEASIRTRRLEIRSNPYLLENAIEAISKIDIDDKDIKESSISPFKVEEKISYNDLKRNRHIIDEYKVYQGKIDIIYDELESINPFRKKQFLMVIRNIYLLEKGKITSGIADIDIIRKNSDLILDNVQKEIENKVNINQDYVTIAVPLIMVDAFMRCKILEEPPKSNDS